MFNLQDAKEAIKDKPEFKVMERDGFTVIDYVLQKEDTFKGNYKEILINLRGTAFDNKTGEIISLPFHKFHNLNECDGYMEHEINFNDIDLVQVKEDGSMIRVIPTQGGYRLGTRAGITDVSMKAEEFLANSNLFKEYDDFIKFCIDQELHPIFEFVSPDNKIVLNYEKSSLILLSVRVQFGGYLGSEDLEVFAKSFGIPLVKNLKFDLQTVKNSENSEGIVVTLKNGFKFKVKSDWYVLRHKAKDYIRFSKDVVRLIIDDQVDDVLPLLSEEDKEKLNNYRSYFKVCLMFCTGRLQEQFLNTPYLSSKKEFAEKVLSEFKDDSTELFKMYDKELICVDFVEGLINNKIRRNLGSSTQIEKILNHFDITRWEDFK